MVDPSTTRQLDLVPGGKYESVFFPANVCWRCNHEALCRWEWDAEVRAEARACSCWCHEVFRQWGIPE